ncbi:hypothetical protein GCM10010472_19420 [Pseudonocardia halophobica]|uniref:Mce-associated membrane protein n=1 Tax=Pseudonocardia halophobica TaxID=29401 RepID=A0A9W6L063_9PSEU|nr:hypothetical protein [Pseudonocardia halophobica]GLL09844.1 hypothetical protein GCM10017577_09840 [Pseudonocardia halophobica]
MATRSSGFTDHDLLDGVVDDAESATDGAPDRADRGGPRGEAPTQMLHAVHTRPDPEGAGLEDTVAVDTVAEDAEFNAAGSADTAASGRRRRTPRIVGRALRVVATGLRAAGAVPGRVGRAYRTRLDRNPRSVLLVAGIAALVLVLLAGAGVWFWRAAASAESDRQAARDAAIAAVPALLSYDPNSVDSLIDRAGPGLTDSFRQDYGALVTQVVAPAAKNQQITTNTEIKGSSVVLDAQAADENVVLLFVNQTTQSPNVPAPAQSGSRVRVTLDRVDGRWLVSDLKPI